MTSKNHVQIYVDKDNESQTINEVRQVIDSVPVKAQEYCKGRRYSFDRVEFTTDADRAEEVGGRTCDFLYCSAFRTEGDAVALSLSDLEGGHVGRGLRYAATHYVKAAFFEVPGSAYLDGPEVWVLAIYSKLAAYGYAAGWFNCAGTWVVFGFLGEQRRVPPLVNFDGGLRPGKLAAEGYIKAVREGEGGRWIDYHCLQLGFLAAFSNEGTVLEDTLLIKQKHSAWKFRYRPKPIKKEEPS